MRYGRGDDYLRDRYWEDYHRGGHDDSRRDYMAPAGRDAQETLEMIKSLNGVSVYGFLLAPDPQHPVSKLVSERWSQYHYLTGKKFLLVAFHPPAEWTEGFKDYWKQQLGHSFERIWEDWKRGHGLEPGVAYTYLDLFEVPKIQRSQLPCLVLFTDPLKRRAVVRSIPRWDPESLDRLLTGIFETILECCEQQDQGDERLECLQRSLTSPSARALAQLRHARGKAEKYLREHPAQAVATSLSFVLALSTANILPIALGPAAIAMLQTLRDTFSKGHE